MSELVHLDHWWPTLGEADLRGVGGVDDQGLARTQIPTNRNYAPEFPTFGEIAGVNQLRSAMEEPRPGVTTSVIMV